MGDPWAVTHHEDTPDDPWRPLAHEEDAHTDKPPAKDKAEAKTQAPAFPPDVKDALLAIAEAQRAQAECFDRQAAAIAEASQDLTHALADIGATLAGIADMMRSRRQDVDTP
jgi:uncharacterized protein YukE